MGLVAQAPERRSDRGRNRLGRRMGLARGRFRQAGDCSRGIPGYAMPESWRAIAPSL